MVVRNNMLGSGCANLKSQHLEGKSLSSKPAWSIEGVPRQQGLQRETLSRIPKTVKERETQLQQAALWPPHGVCVICAPSTPPLKKTLYTSYFDTTTKFIFKMSFYCNYIQKYYGVVNSSQKKFAQNFRLHESDVDKNLVSPSILIVKQDNSLSQMKEREEKHIVWEGRDRKEQKLKQQLGLMVQIYN